MEFDDLKARRDGVGRGDAEALDDRVELTVAQHARPCGFARRAHRGRRDRMKPLLGTSRLAAEVHELAGRDRALGADRLRARRHPRNRLGPPRFGGDPPPPRRLARGHRPADRDHRRTAARTAAPVLGVLRQRQPVLDDPAPVGGAHEPVAQREPRDRNRLGRAHHICGPRPPLSARYPVASSFSSPHSSSSTSRLMRQPPRSRRSSRW